MSGADLEMGIMRRGHVEGLSLSVDLARSHSSLFARAGEVSQTARRRGSEGVEH